MYNNTRYTLLSCTITCLVTSKQGEKENERLVGYNHNYSFVNSHLLRASSHLSSLTSETSHTLLSPLSSHSTNKPLAPSSHWPNGTVLSFLIHMATYLCNELIYWKNESNWGWGTIYWPDIYTVEFSSMNCPPPSSPFQQLEFHHSGDNRRFGFLLRILEIWKIQSGYHGIWKL